MKGKTSPRGDGSKDSGNADKAAITNPIESPANPDPKVLESSWLNKVRSAFIGRVVIVGVNTSPKSAPTKPKITAPSSIVIVVTFARSTPKYPPNNPNTIMPIIRKTNSRLIIPLLKKKNSEHQLSVLAVTNPIQERYIDAKILS